METVHENHGRLSCVLQPGRLTRKGKTVEGSSALQSILEEAACRYQDMCLGGWLWGTPLEKSCTET